MISPRNKVQSILKCLKRCLCFPSWSLIPQGYINVIFSNDRKINSEYHMYFLLGHWSQRTHCDEAYLVIKTELDTSKIYLEMCFKEEQLDLSDHRECAFFFDLKREQLRFMTSQSKSHQHHPNGLQGGNFIVSIGSIFFFSIFI